MKTDNPLRAHHHHLTGRHRLLHALALTLVLLGFNALAAADVNGSNVTKVVCQKGGALVTYSQTAPKKWSDGQNALTERERDEWSVYLEDGRGGEVQLDLFQKKANLTGNLSGVLPIVTVSAAAPEPAGEVKGANVTKVTSGNTVYAQTGAGKWTDGRGTLTEIERDEWSVYLDNGNGGQVQLDLYQKKVIMSGNLSGASAITSSAVAPFAPAPVQELTTNDKVILRSLGFGFDATGFYADQRMIRDPIFEVQGPQDYSYRQLTPDGKIEVRSGSNATQFSEDLSVNVEGGAEGGLWSASVKVGVSKSRSGSQKTTFYQVDDTLYHFTARLKGNARPSAAALHDLNNMDPAAAVRKYGTHYINFAEYGGLLSFLTFEEETERSDGTTVDVEAQASYGIASGKVGVSASQSTAAQNMSKRGTFRVCGGDAALNDRSQLDNQLYTEWKRGVEKNPGLAGFGDDSITDGLRGIWMVPGVNANRARALEAAVKAYVQSRGAGVFNVASKMQPTVAKNSAFGLKGQDGKWLGGYHSASDGYYLKTAGAGQMHQFDTNGEKLRSGEVVRIKTQQGGQSRSWSNYVYVCIGSTPTAYYYPTSGDSTNWIVWKGTIGGSRGDEIRYGDSIVLESASYKGQCLQPAPNYHPYLSTRGDNFTWTIRQGTSE